MDTPESNLGKYIVIATAWGQNTGYYGPFDTAKDAAKYCNFWNDNPSSPVEATIQRLTVPK